MEFYKDDDFDETKLNAVRHYDVNLESITEGFAVSSNNYRY